VNLGGGGNCREYTLGFGILTTSIKFGCICFYTFIFAKIKMRGGGGKFAKETFAWVSVLVCIILLVFSVLYTAANDLPECIHSGGDRNGCGGHAPDTLDTFSVKSGDILCLSYSGARSMFSKIVYGSNWTHTGLIWRSPSGEPYVLEASGYLPPYNSLVVRVPLHHWIRVNRNVAAISHLQINKELSSDALSHTFNYFETKDIGIDTLTMRWFNFLSKRRANDLPKDCLFRTDNVKSQSRKYADFNPLRSLAIKTGWHPESKYHLQSYDYAYTCHEILIFTLQVMGVYSREYTPCSYLPSCIANRKIQTINGYSYSSPKQVTTIPEYQIGWV